MSIFTILGIAFILFKVISYLINKGLEPNKENQQNAMQILFDKKTADQMRDFKKLETEKLYSLLESCKGFTPSETIVSPYGFFLFSMDDENGEFIFITENNIHRFAFRNLKDYDVRVENNSSIYIDLEINNAHIPELTIECFNKEKLFWDYSKSGIGTSADLTILTDLNSLYSTELDAVDDVEYMLDDILDYHDNEDQTPPQYDTPPQYIEKDKPEIEEKLIEKQIPQPNVLDIVVDIKNISNEIKVEETIEKIIPDPTTSKEEIIHNVVIEEQAVDDDTEANGTKISISEIEDLSRGQFLSSDLRSAISDAKIKGKKFIYISDEELDELKK